MAGIFEETARFVSFKILKKIFTGISTGLSYGIGHGGIESVLLAGFSMIAGLVFGILINTGNIGIITGKDIRSIKYPIEYHLNNPFIYVFIKWNRTYFCNKYTNIIVCNSVLFGFLQ